MKKAIALTCAFITALVLTVTLIPVSSFANTEDAVSPAAEPVSSVEGTSGMDPADRGKPSEPAGSSDSTDVPDSTDVSAPAEPAEPAEQSFDQLRPEVKAKVRGAGIEVSWEPIDGAKRYRVYRAYSVSAKTSAYTLLEKTTSTSFVDQKVKSGKKAYYYVRAYDGSRYTKYSEAAVGRIIRVYVETGHGIDSRGKWDPGCRWGKYQEAKLMIPIAKATTKYLRANGIYVYTDAYSGNNRNLIKTIKFIRKHSVSVFLNIHCDYKNASSGTIALYRTKEQKKLATALNKGVHSEVKIRDKGLKKRMDLKSLNPKYVKVSSCLYETGCISKNNKTLREEADAYGKGFAKGICNYLGVEFR